MGARRWRHRRGAHCLALAAGDSGRAGRWGGMWAERIVSSTIAEGAVATGLATRDELRDIADGWRAWTNHRDG